MNEVKKLVMDIASTGRSNVPATVKRFKILMKRYPALTKKQIIEWSREVDPILAYALEGYV
jgi:hypothetical protein